MANRLDTDLSVCSSVKLTLRIYEFLTDYSGLLEGRLAMLLDGDKPAVGRRTRFHGAHRSCRFSPGVRLFPVRAGAIQARRETLKAS
jgi:hypothetical protein